MTVFDRMFNLTLFGKDVNDMYVSARRGDARKRSVNIRGFAALFEAAAAVRRAPVFLQLQRCQNRRFFKARVSSF